MKRVALGALNLYQRFAPRHVRDACLFQPSCSVYAQLAIEEHGVLRGVALAAKRLKRCVRPNGGIDLTGLSIDATEAIVSSERSVSAYERGAFSRTSPDT